ncbi:MAG: hypothetical protein Q9184_004180 [Pyrenodesmia sp. 2 TL-2023]
MVTHVQAEADAVSYGRVNRHIRFMQRIYRRLTEGDDVGRTSTIVTLVATGFVYTALYLALCYHEIPTAAEKLLWRISASSLLAVPLMVPFGRCVSMLYRRIAATINRRTQSPPSTRQSGPSSCPVVESPNPEHIVEEESASTRSKGTTGATTTAFAYPTLTTTDPLEWAALAFFLVAALYTSSHIFIIVESFLSLRHVPIGVYAGVGWSKHIPHL